MKFFILLFLSGWMLLIIGFSAQPAVESRDTSGTVVQTLVNLFTTLLPIYQSTTEQQMLVQHLHGTVRKVAHGVNYFILGGLAYQAIRLNSSVKKKAWHLAAAAMLFCVTFAALDELHQVYVPGRSGELRDVLIDSGSALAGILFCWGYGLSRAVKRK